MQGRCIPCSVKNIYFICIYSSSTIARQFRGGWGNQKQFLDKRTRKTLQMMIIMGRDTIEYKVGQESEREVRKVHTNGRELKVSLLFGNN